MEECEGSQAQLQRLIGPLVARGWRKRKFTDWWDRDLGPSIMVTLVRGEDILDVELFETRWLHAYSYDTHYVPDIDHPSDPLFAIDDPDELVAKCMEHGLIG